MTTSHKLLGLVVALALAGCSQATPPAETVAPPAAVEAAPAPVEAAPPVVEAAAVPAPKLQAALRDVWHGHIVHARDYAIAMHAGKPADAKAAAATECPKEGGQSTTITS